SREQHRGSPAALQRHIHVGGGLGIVLAGPIVQHFSHHWAFASMANLIVEAVPGHQTGVATGMNTIVRTIGGAIGSQVTAGIVTATVAAKSLPAENGFTIAFAASAAALAIGFVVALTFPARG